MYDLHKLSDTHSILMYYSVVKIKQNCGPEFLKIKLKSCMLPQGNKLLSTKILGAKTEAVFN